MADNVARNLERALPEYEQMKALKLFSDDEIKHLKKQRENLEYKINQQSPTLKSYCEYLEHMDALAALIRQRQGGKKKHTIISHIAKRMKILYEAATKRFSGVLRIWNENIKFLTVFGFKNEVSKKLDDMLMFHAKNPNAWIQAIMWEYNMNYNKERVKGLLLRAQQHHPDSELINLIFFEIELENGREADEELALKHAIVIYTSATKQFDGIQFYLKMLKTIDRYPYANALKETMLHDLKEKFAGDELMWHTMAQRVLNDTSEEDKLNDLKDDVDAMEEDGDADGDESDDKPEKKVQLSAEDRQKALEVLQRKRLDLVVAVYKKAIEELKTEKMWSYYVDAMCKLNDDTTYLIDYKRFLYFEALKECSKTDYMSELHYAQYLEVLYHLSKRLEDQLKISPILKTFDQAVGKYPKSTKLWMMYTTFYIQRSELSKVNSVLERAVPLLGIAAIPLWEKYLNFTLSHRSPKYSAAFKKSSNKIMAFQQPEYNKLKATLVELHAKKDDIAQARQVYKQIVSFNTNCVEVHEKMLDLEQTQGHSLRVPKKERQVLDTMVHLYGTTRTNVWISYLRFERELGSPLNMTVIHQRALNTLKPEFKDDFTAAYNDTFINSVV